MPYVSGSMYAAYLDDIEEGGGYSGSESVYNIIGASSVVLTSAEIDALASSSLSGNANSDFSAFQVISSSSDFAVPKTKSRPMADTG